jgi:hypothetical protein
MKAAIPAGGLGCVKALAVARSKAVCENKFYKLGAHSNFVEIWKKVR